MQLKGVQVAHAIPGRIRLKIQQIRDNPELAWEVEEQLSRISGVSRVEANPVTGSVVVLFEERGSHTAESLQFLSSTWPAELGTFDPGAWENGHNGHANGSAPGAALDRRIAQLFGTVNAGVTEVAYGADLRVILPLFLFALGVRGLFAEKLPFPVWYDFFWFALSTFVMLNRSVIDGPAGAPGPAHS